MIRIRFKNEWLEIPYKSTTLSLNFAIDSTFDNAYFETPALSGIGSLDLTKRIPRGLLVELTIENEVYEFITGECQANVVSYNPKKAEHQVTLLSLVKETTKKTLENITLKQPKGDLGVYHRSVNSIQERELLTLNRTLNLVTTVNTNYSKTNGLQIISLEPYQIASSFLISYGQDASATDIVVRIKYGSTVVHQDFIKIKQPPFTLFPTGKMYNVNKSITFNFTPTTSDTFSVELEKTVGAFFVEINEASLSITAQEVLTKPVRTYAQLVDKLLRNTNYVLGASSRHRLNLTAPEVKFEEYMLYDSLQTIGSQLGALVRVGGVILRRFWQLTTDNINYIDGDSIYDFNNYDYDLGQILKVGNNYYKNTETNQQAREIIFEFFDKPEVKEIIGERNRTELAEYEDYVSAIELNTKNVIKPRRYSPFKNGFGTLRNLEGIGKLTTSNIGYFTEENQERIIKVLVKGLASVSNNHTWTVDDVTDITSRVLLDKQYNTLESQTDYTYAGKLRLLKNNCLYTVQGSNAILGMSYVGETERQLIGNPDVTRALYETILAQRTNDVQELVTRTGNQSNDDPGLVGDLQIQIHVEYEALTESRARVYKKDQSGFETDYVKYVNESSNVNDTQAIGDYSQLLVNRLGGTKVIVDGQVDSIYDVLKVGDMDASGRVLSNVLIRKGSKLEYQYVFVQDYNVISSYIGVNSRHRVEEISSDSTTLRTLRYTSKVYFTENEEPFSTRLIDINYMFRHLVSLSSVGINYGYIEMNHANGDKRRLHLSTDTDSKGQTIEVKWRMADNYSGGMKRYPIVVSGQTVYMTSEVPYTDVYGKVTDILFNLFETNDGAIDMELYPETTASNGVNPFVVITDFVDKDESEILSGLVEVPFLSNTPKIRVYNGFAKYNPILGANPRIGVVALQYVPLIKDTKIDLSRSIEITASGSLEFGKVIINVDLPASSKGIAYYNIDTLDLILAYVDDLESGTQEIVLNYIIEDSEQGGGVNFTIRFSEVEMIFTNAFMAYGLSINSVNASIEQSDLIFGQDEAMSFNNSELVNIFGNVIYGSNYQPTFQLIENSELTFGQDESVEFNNIETVAVQGYMTYANQHSSVAEINGQHNLSFGQEESADFNNTETVTVKAFINYANQYSAVAEINDHYNLSFGKGDIDYYESTITVYARSFMSYSQSYRGVFNPNIISELDYPKQANAWVEVTYSDYLNASENGSVLITPIRSNCPTITSTNAGNPTHYNVDFVMAVQGARLCGVSEPCPPQGYVSCGWKYYKAVII